MLASLHVKNLALIDEEEIIFSKGLNILSGETGAGKSIILGALNLSLGDKASKDFLRDANSEAFVEAVYLINDEATKEVLRAMGVEPYDDEIIMSRRITEARSVGKINGEQVPAAKMKEVGALLLDIYGQKEHQSLLNTKRHMELLDEFAKNDIGDLKEKIADAYKEYKTLSAELEEAKQSDVSKEREIVLLDHEINEIEAANLKVGEDEELEDYIRSPHHDIEGLYQHVVAEKQAYEKRLIMNTLRQNGIYGLLTKPRKLTVDVINKYLEMKSRSLIG